MPRKQNIIYISPYPLFQALIVLNEMLLRIIANSETGNSGYNVPSELASILRSFS